MEEHKKRYKYKYCLVPLCDSTTLKNPDKIFIQLPQEPSRRLKWLKACRSDNYDLSSKSVGLFVCEDHFDLQEDMENYMRFKLMGGYKKMKPEVVPHIFRCHDRKRAYAQPEAELSLKIDMECPTEESVRKVQPLVHDSNEKEILDQPKFKKYLADRYFDIKLENIRSFDYGTEEIHMKREIEDVKLENEGVIIKNEALFYYSAEEIHMKNELGEVKLENEELFVKNEADDEIDMVKTEFGRHTNDLFEQPTEVTEF